VQALSNRRLPVAARLLAQSCWLQCDGNKRAAIKLFKQSWHGEPISRVGRLFDRWAERDMPFPASPPGPQPMIDDKVARSLARIFKQGYKPRVAPRRGYRNVAHAVRLSKKFESMVQATGACHRTVLRAMKRVDPKLGRVRQTVKPLLSQKEKDKRQRLAAQLRRMPATVRKASQYMDEASYNMDNLKCKVYGDTSVGEIVVEDTRAPRTRDQRQLLNFCVVFNWSRGPVAIVFVSGTKGLPGSHYLVRTYLHTCTHRILPSAPCLGRVAPQFKHAKAIAAVAAPHDKVRARECSAIVHSFFQLGIKVRRVPVGNPQHAMPPLPCCLHFFIVAAAHFVI